jgi:uncharacterized Zn finger protein (UPF0148 family)
MFKEKSSKKRLNLPEGSKEITTLDARHQQMILQLQHGIQEKSKLLESQKMYQDHLDYWKSQIRDLYQKEHTDTLEYEIAWTSNLYFSNCIRLLQEQTKKIMDERREIEYYENTANILFEYYDLLDNQEALVSTQTNNIESIYIPPHKTKGRKKYVPPNQKNILEAFMLVKPVQEEPNTVYEENEEREGELENPMEQKSFRDKATLVDDYMLLVDSNHIKTVNHQMLGDCQKCNVPLVCLLQEGIMICPTCGYQELLLVEQNRPIYRQSNKEASHQSYKRINHFNEWISQIQGKESTDIPEEIFEKIVQEIKKEKIRDTAKLSYHKLREILKKLKANKYYEHIYYIIYRLNGISPPNFSPDMEEKLRNMFKEIQGPFLKHCPPKRKNFLSYSYVLFKFCQLLEKDEYLKHFSLLKSREKLHIQDQIWKNICEEIRWEFIQSI